MNTAPHIPVMLNEVLEFLKPEDGKVYVDGTFGAGGYSRAILESADCTLIAIDRDDTALDAAQEFKDEFSERFVFLSGCFGNVEQLLADAGFDGIDGFVLDLGVSSMQLDQADRGFSFRFDGPLDMRMGRGSGGRSAADVVNEADEKELADIIYKYGEDRKSRYIARAIVERRVDTPFETTLDLANIVRDVVFKSPKDKIDPATRTFQALRIVVNDELGELERALNAAKAVLNDNGRMVIVTFHSLEDRIVKNDFKEKIGTSKTTSRHAPMVLDVDDPDFKILTRKAVLASADEIAINARSRSAKLRAIQKIGGAA